MKNQTNKDTGTFSLASRGFGFVKRKKGKDVFIPAKHILSAVSGDEVEIIISGDPNRPEGKVTRILKRATNKLTVIVIGKERDGYLCYSVVLGSNKSIYLDSTEKLRSGDRLLVEVKSWHPKLRVVFNKNLGNIEDPSIDIKICAYDFNLKNKFSAKEEDIATIVNDNPTAEREDLTGLECVTIDPDDAKDFDDALSLEVDDEFFYLGVHIADVSHYVTAKSILDRAAFERGNSTYFPGICFPMLPSGLSFESCSLKPDVERFVVSVLLKFNKDGVLIHQKIVRAKIKSRKRFTYKEALSILQNNQPSSHKTLLMQLSKLAFILKKIRLRRGCVDISMPEARVIISPNGDTERIVLEEHDIAHQLVEEFMIKANEVVATWASNKKGGSIYRVHEEPEKDSLNEFYVSARSLGCQLPRNPTRADVQAMFNRVKNDPVFLQHLSLLYIKSMKLAEYSTDATIGHYGLGLKKYTHFTSPIRRYADLVIHRILFGEKLEKDKLDKICNHLCMTERNSMRAEQTLNKLKKIRLLQKCYMEDRGNSYEALVSKIRPFAIFFDLVDYYIEGSIHISELGNEYFVFDSKKHALVGKRSGLTLALGSRIRVKIISLSLTLQEIVFALV